MSDNKLIPEDNSIVGEQTNEDIEVSEISNIIKREQCVFITIHEKNISSPTFPLNPANTPVDDIHQTNDSFIIDNIISSTGNVNGTEK